MARRSGGGGGKVENGAAVPPLGLNDDISMIRTHSGIEQECFSFSSTYTFNTLSSLAYIFLGYIITNITLLIEESAPNISSKDNSKHEYIYAHEKKHHKFYE